MEWSIIAFLVGMLIGVIGGIVIAERLIREDKERHEAMGRIDTAELDKEEEND